MRSKAPLALMEQLVMVLVFALAAAVCLQVFVCGDLLSRESQVYDRAVLAAQSAAEHMRHARGDGQLAARNGGGNWDGREWNLWYNENGEPVERESEARFTLCVTETDSGQPLLGRAEVTASARGEVLFVLPVAWQEVDEHGPS